MQCLSAELATVIAGAGKLPPGFTEYEEQMILGLAARMGINRYSIARQVERFGLDKVVAASTKALVRHMESLK